MGKTAIVVDDEPIIRLDLSQMLEELGLTVVADAADGFDAVEACRLHAPDVVLLDLNMPVFDGLSAAETIISESLAGAVVAVTAFADPPFIERAVAIGVTGYIVKPIEQRLLLPAIEVAFAQSSRLRAAQNDVQAAEKKLAGLRQIDHAKTLLAKEKQITEAEAYRELQQMAMTKRCSMAQLAEALVERSTGRAAINDAKTLLMKKRGLSEQNAHALLAKMAGQEKKSLAEIARDVVKKGGVS
ncbi:MAG TPA: response regulator [Clostridia bacterium]|nr:response regulator [Clostridia bacterium]